MRSIVLILPFLSVLLEGTVFVTFPATLLLVTIYAMVFGRKSLGTLFLTGIFLDIYSMTIVGSHSVYFLVVYWIVDRYQKKMHAGVIFYPMVFIAGVVAVYQYFFHGHIEVLEVGISILVAMCLLWLVSRLSWVQESV